MRGLRQVNKCCEVIRLQQVAGLQAAVADLGVIIVYICVKALATPKNTNQGHNGCWFE